ncbi:MAG: 50S ribosomal protein L16 [Candidatus Woesearchaeota archaeon]|nr:MAG: 50S ribosomal protein L16 [Candidatus Woesearchaeota archaeon]
MVGLRKGRCYRHVKRPYTRKSKYKIKGFVKAIPPSKIIHFDMGNLQKPFPIELSLISKDALQIRHNALESARQIVNRRLTNLIGSTNFHLKVRTFPHHVLRENKMITGAGADRMQTGMQQAFGRPVGVAAQIKKGQKIMTVYGEEKDRQKMIIALKLAYPRLPGRLTIN